MAVCLSRWTSRERSATSCFKTLGIMSAIDGQMLTFPSGYNLAQIASDSQNEHGLGVGKMDDNHRIQRLSVGQCR
jgi:hypothetical protein